MRWLARIWPSNAVRRRAGECPAPLQIGECANRFRNGRRSTRAAVSHQSQPIAVENRAVTHALMLRRTSERARSWLARAHGKSIPPRKLERQQGGASVGAAFIRSFGVWFLYEIRRYKSIEKCGERSIAALGRAQFEEQMNAQTEHLLRLAHCVEGGSLNHGTAAELNFASMSALAVAMRRKAKIFADSEIYTCDPKQTWRHGLAIAHLMIDLVAGSDIT
jgi:hypothetical protein